MSIMDTVRNRRGFEILDRYRKGRGPMTHDLSGRAWGNNYEVMKAIDGGKELELAGWRLGIRKGDFLILKNGADTTRYEVDTIRYCADPHDMWFASATFAPRPAEEVAQ